MKKLAKLVLCLVMCIFVIGGNSVFASAASLGKVKTVKATEVTTSKVSLKWSKVSGATGYKIYKYDTNTKKWVNIKNTTNRTYSVTSLNSATTYKFKVKAYAKKDSETYYGSSSSAFSVTTLPKTPSGLKVNSTSTSKVKLSWDKVEGATGYKIYRYDESAQKWKSVKMTTASSCTVSSLSSSTTYKFRVRAYKKTGNSYIYSSPTSAVKTTTVPDKVTGLSVSSVTSSSAVLSWSAVKGATGYRIFRYNPSTEKYVRVATTKNTSYKLTSLSTATAYKIKVKAYCSASPTVWGSASEEFSFTTAPAKVSSLKLSAYTSNSCTLTWKKVTGATGYQVVRYDLSSKKWKAVATVTTESYTAENLACASSVQYKVRALVINSLGVTYGEYSSSLTASTAPAVPENLKASLSGNSAVLSWSASDGATGYTVEKYDASKGKWTTVAQIKETTYTDTSLSETSVYTYRVIAYYTQGNTSYYSNHTSSVSVSYEAKKSSNEYIEQMQKEGIFGYLYDAQGNYFYTAADPWQRVAGYNEVYDVIAPFTLINYDTERVYFSWNNKDWLVQFWKGQYGLVFYGAEIGVYNKPSSRTIPHYDCATDDDMLKMSMTFIKRKNVFSSKTDWVEVFTRPYGEYWWCTGFIPGNVMGNYQNLRIDARITMEDYDMLVAFKKGLDATSMTYTVSGLDINIVYA